MARKPLDFFDTFLKTSSSPVEKHSQAFPSLLTLAALRQSVKVVQSNKMPSECRAAVAGYVSSKSTTLSYTAVFQS